jgi:hypothetical protein
MNTINMYCYMCNKSGHTTTLSCSAGMADTEKTIISRLRLDVSRAACLREIELCKAYQKMQQNFCSSSSGYEMINKELKAIGERQRYINGVIITVEAEYNFVKLVNHHIINPNDNRILHIVKCHSSRAENLCAEIMRVENICTGLFAELLKIIVHITSKNRSGIDAAILRYGNIRDDIQDFHLLLNELDKCWLFDKASSHMDDVGRRLPKEGKSMSCKQLQFINLKNVFIKIINALCWIVGVVSIVQFTILGIYISLYGDDK